MGKFLIKETDSGCRFNLVAGNGQVIGTSQTYSSIDACKNGIESVKTNYQSTSNEKSMVLRVIDKELLQKTGGIIQGMSGSPIIQNDRVIGAVTHVFINDPTKGFGVYLDWMINQ